MPRASHLGGNTLGHYRIEALIGEGGMGVVYRAFDTKLERRVAIKVLRSEALGDPERKRRFVQEARAASALNHPNIVTIHDIAEHDGMEFIVMEYVPGRTLAERIGKEPMPIANALGYGVQVADALARAHAVGIVHRDIKPDNIIVSDDDRLKVLDFGLAKLLDASEAPTTNAAFDPEAEGTLLGSVLGTAEYMSPEQAAGTPADERSDIFSFGAVLYEMLTGRRAFAATTKQEAMNAVMAASPVPLSKVVRSVPPALERAVLKCLAKEPADRYQKMAMVRAALQQSVDDLQPKTRRKWILAGIAVVALVIAAAAVNPLMEGWRNLTRLPTRVIPITTYPGVEVEPAISPDGTRVAFLWNGDDGGTLNLYVKAVAGGEPLRLSTDMPDGTSAVTRPAWSRDGTQVAYLQQAGTSSTYDVMIVLATGGTPRQVGTSGEGMDWSPQRDSLVIVEPVRDQPRGLLLLSLKDGQTQRLTTATKRRSDRLPRFAPDGKRVAFIRSSQGAGESLCWVSIEGGPEHEVLVERRGFSGFDWTADGKELVYAWNSREAQPSMYRVSADGGTPEQVISQGYNPSVARFSDRMAYQQEVHNDNAWRVEIAGVPNRGNALPGRAKRLIASTNTNTDIRYSSDGTKIAFASTREGNSDIWVSDGEGQHARRITTNIQGTGSPSWSPDGKDLAFDSGNQIYRVSTEGGSPKALTSGGLNILPCWSKDGRWIYFTSNRNGPLNIWRMPADGGQSQLITRNGGWESKVSADGKLIYYVKANGRTGSLWTVPADGGLESPVSGMPDSMYRREWDITSEGIFFLQKDDPIIHFLSFKTRKATPVYTLDRILTLANRNLAVSPDGKWLTWVQVDVDTKDISVVDHFR